MARIEAWLIRRVTQYVNLPYYFHLSMGVLIRLLLIAYASFHDKMYELQYTDVDYRVFTDAARHIVNGDSPYKRSTYRYSPLIAMMLTPNIFIHQDFGKLLFSLFDILIAIACKRLVEKQLAPLGKYTRVPTYCVQLWLYNPMSIAISTRGNADSVPCFFIIMSLYFLRSEMMRKPLIPISLAGFFLGLSIHLRLYPIAFSFPMFLSLGDYHTINHGTGILDGLRLLLPNKKQLTLTASCLFTVITLTYGMYALYGYEFLFETYIYHLFRKDTRHNFSVLFYYSYLTMDELQLDLMKMITQIFEGMILFMISLKLGLRQDSLPFAMFCQAVVLVAFNTVLTSQYFIWFLSLLPLVAHCFNMPSVYASYMAFAWIISQTAWLFYAYMLEFRNQDVFIYVWLKSVFFFIAHVYVLTQLIKNFQAGYGFGLVTYPKTRVNVERKNQ